MNVLMFIALVVACGVAAYIAFKPTNENEDQEKAAETQITQSQWVIYDEETLKAAQKKAKKPSTAKKTKKTKSSKS